MIRFLLQMYIKRASGRLPYYGDSTPIKTNVEAGRRIQIRSRYDLQPMIRLQGFAWGRSFFRLPDARAGGILRRVKFLSIYKYLQRSE